MCAMKASNAFCEYTISKTYLLFNLFENSNESLGIGDSVLVYIITMLKNSNFSTYGRNIEMMFFFERL